MRPKKRYSRNSDYYEDSNMSFLEDPVDKIMPEYERRIESLKRAIEIAKLIDGVDVPDVFDIAQQVDDYLAEEKI